MSYILGLEWDILVGVKVLSLISPTVATYFETPSLDKDWIPSGASWRWAHFTPTPTVLVISPEDLCDLGTSSLICLRYVTYLHLLRMRILPLSPPDRQCLGIDIKDAIRSRGPEA